MLERASFNEISSLFLRSQAFICACGTRGRLWLSPSPPMTASVASKPGCVWIPQVHMAQAEPLNSP